MHWTERSRAVVNIGRGLEAAGWTLHGFNEAESDPMADYYKPASWSGIASKDGYVVVVDLPESGIGQEYAKRHEIQFRPNPPRKLWHVEMDGRILDSGVGLRRCADWDREVREGAVKKIVDRIEYALGRPAQTDAEVTIRRNPVKDGIEVIFPAKPDQEIRDALKRFGFRWSRRQGLWYVRYRPGLWSGVHALLGKEIPDEQEG